MITIYNEDTLTLSLQTTDTTIEIQKIYNNFLVSVVTARYKLITELETTLNDLAIPKTDDLELPLSIIKRLKLLKNRYIANIKERIEINNELVRLETDKLYPAMMKQVQKYLSGS